jgi:hypothetical protein
VVAYSGELDEVLELGVSQDFSRDRVLSRVLDNTLRLSILILFNLDDAGCEALFELFLVFPRDGSTKDDMGEESI